jgi:probable rRNA maturation factor
MVDDREITRLNEDYLHRPKPTNVIAFPMQQGRFSEVNPNLLGDVVISLDTASREARDALLSLETRFDQLLIHGILHLLGFDHEADSASARAMEAKEKELLALL